MINIMDLDISVGYLSFSSSSHQILVCNITIILTAFCVKGVIHGLGVGGLPGVSLEAPASEAVEIRAVASSGRRAAACLAPAV